MSESGEPSASPTVRNHLVVDADLHTNSDYRLFTFVSQLPEEETARVPIICITEVEGQLLCAIPGTAWNRLVRLRILPPKSFLQATSVAVAAAELGARNLVSEGVFIRVWLGFLAAPFEECLEVFSEDLDRAFVTEDGDIGHLPFSDALLQVADEKFSFVSAMSGEPVEEASEVGVRVSKLEAGLQSVQATLQQLVQLQSPNPITQKTTAVLLPPKPKPAAVKDPLHGDGIAGLDASAVRAALDAGIPRAHLEQVSQLLLGRKPKFADAPGAKVEKKKPRLDVLGDTEDEAEVAEDAAPVPVPDPGVDPVGHALVKLTAIVDHLTVARKKPRSLEDTLDDSGLLQDSLSSGSSVGSSRKHAQVYQMLRKALKDSPEEIYAIIEKRMLADFGSAELAPGAPSSSSGTFRGWCEHRSRVPNIPQSVRTMWAVAGALDALRAGHIAEGKARLALFLGQLDQLAIDRGQVVLMAEGSLEEPPPFASFGKHTLPDYYEAQATKLWPSVWTESFMWKVKELDEFIDRRSKLGKRGGNPTNPAVTTTDPPKGGKTKQQTGKGGGKPNKEGKASSSSQGADDNPQN